MVDAASCAAVTNFRIAHWSRWRTYHTPMSAFGTRAAMNLFWIWYWHIPLTMGRTLLITPSAYNVDVVQLVRYLGTSRASYVDCLTPSQMQLICELCEELPPTLRHVFSSGEALTLATARSFLRKFPAVRLHNLLATTETSADICMLKDIEVCTAMTAQTPTQTPAQTPGSNSRLKLPTQAPVAAAPSSADWPAVESLVGTTLTLTLTLT